GHTASRGRSTTNELRPSAGAIAGARAHDPAAVSGARSRREHTWRGAVLLGVREAAMSAAVLPPPPSRGRVGVGERARFPRQFELHEPIIAARPPSLTLPHEGGGDSRGRLVTRDARS